VDCREIFLSIMNSNDSTQQITSRLEQVRRSIRRVQALRGLMVLATVAIGGLLVLMAADLFFAPLAIAVRWVLLGLWICGVILAVRFGFRPLWRKISLVQIARWVEIRHPEMQERLSTVLELGPGSGASGSLLAALGQAAGEDAGKVDAKAEVAAARTIARWARPAIAVLVLLAVALIAWPSETVRLLVRAVAPFSAKGNIGADLFLITPGNLEVLSGDRVEIQIAYKGSAKSIELLMDFENGQRISQKLQGVGGNFSYILEPARKTFKYRARAGRAESDAFLATVWPLPALGEPRVRREFPQYTGVLPADEPLGRSIEGVAGTLATLSGTLATPIESAWLTVNDRRIAESAAAAGGLSLAWELGPEDSGEAVLILNHRLGREVEALRFSITVQEDRAPDVAILAPAATDLRVRPDEILNLRYEATDDFSVVRVVLEVDSGDGNTGAIPQSLPECIEGSVTSRFRDTLKLQLAALRAVYPGSEMRLRVMAEDGRPQSLGGPGQGHSQWLTLRFDDSAETLVRQELREQQKDARDGVEQAINQARDARDQLERQRADIQKDEIPQETRKQLEEAAAKLAAAQEKLDALAERMQETLQAGKAEEVREASEILEQARQQAEDAPLQDSAAEREAMLEAARQQADEAVKQLEAVREALDRDRQKIEDLTRVAELAQQQREVARQAEANLAEPPEQAAQSQAPGEQMPVAVPNEWREEQKRVEEALRQQLRERPDARAEALQAQADEARALAEEARETAAAQKNLQEQVAQQAGAEEPGPDLMAALVEALAQEQTKIAEESRQQQESAPAPSEALTDAIAAAEEAKDALESGKMQAAAAATEAASESLQQAAQTPGQPEQGEAEQGQAEQGQAEQGQAEQGQAEQGQAEQGQAEQGQAEQGMAEQGQAEQGQAEQGQAEQGQAEQGQAEQGQAEQGMAEQGMAEQGMAEQGQTEQGQAPNPVAEAVRAEVLDQLAQRQEQVAEAVAALAQGDVNAALQQLQELRAEAAAELAQATQALPQIDHNGAVQDARNATKSGSEKAAAAAAQSGENPQQSAQQHEQSATDFENAANALDLAAKELDSAAQNAASQQPNPNSAQLPPGQMAEAFQEASQAASSQQAGEAAQQAANAAEALAQAVEAGMQQMKGESGPPGPPGSEPSPPGPPGPPGQPGQPGEEPQEGVASAQADPGVPPELAKLGITASDWEKIQTTLRADIGAGEADAVPEGYRELVKGYFENITKGAGGK